MHTYYLNLDQPASQFLQESELYKQLQRNFYVSENSEGQPELVVH